MNLLPTISLDARDADQVVAELTARRPGFAPQWLPSDSGADIAVVQIFARYLQAAIQRLNQAPAKNKLAFLDLLGIQLIPAQAARAPLVFQLSAGAADARLPANTRVAAPPPPEHQDQIIFETERATGLASARLKQVFSLWPGRDQYIDHSATALAGLPFQPFKKPQLQDTPHVLYLAHDTLLALAGESTVNVEVELKTPGSKVLDIIWEYWDGKVWRGFLRMRPECRDDLAAKLDSTVGLTQSGHLILETAGAQTAQTIVNGIQAFWIRGRLNEPLPPDPAQILPEIETIKLSTQIRRPLDFIAGPAIAKPKGNKGDLCVKVVDEAGKPINDIAVTLIPPHSTRTNGQGEACFSELQSRSSATVSVQIDNIYQSKTFVPADSSSTYEVTFTFSSLKLDKAFADQVSLDVSKTFYPFGVSPQPGAAFYFTNDEIFSKPGASVKVLVQRANTPQDEAGTTPQDEAGTTPQTGYLTNIVAWEYWNERHWVTMFQSTLGTTGLKGSKNLDVTETIEFIVPPDMARLKINDQDGLWMRARLVSGGFGISGLFPNTSVKYVIAQPPALADFRLGYTWQKGPYHAEHVLDYNDFQYEEDTEVARWPGPAFQPFKPMQDATPGLYLGFDKPLPNDRLGLYFDIEEQPGVTNGLALVWQYWDGFQWQDLVVDDETRNLRLPGIVSFIAAEDSQAFARFDTPLHWLRARLKEDGPPDDVTIDGVYLNAVWAVQQQTVTEEPLGASTGQSNQVFTFRQIPVLEGERIEVQELAGPRANVEWRILALELFGGDRGALRDLEAALALEGAQTEIVRDSLRLRRDRNKRVTEAWVRWQPQRHLFFSGPNNRHYVLERARGRLIFGDGMSGKVPPAGAAVQARLYRTGGGLAGNVPARSIKQVLGAIGGLDAAFNPREAEGGADGETPEHVSLRGPRTLHHRGRALTVEDYETLAYETSPAVAVARAIACREPGGRTVPGWVTVVVIPQSAEPQPYPSFGLREQVRQHIEAQASASIAAADHVYVTGPEYVPIDVAATVVALDPSTAGTVEQSLLAALQNFLHPLRGGPEGRGWQPGRAVYFSDIAAVLERVAGVDYVKELALFLGGVQQGDQVNVAADQTVVAGELRIRMLEGERSVR